MTKVVISNGTLVIFPLLSLINSYYFKVEDLIPIIIVIKEMKQNIVKNNKGYLMHVCC